MKILRKCIVLMALLFAACLVIPLGTNAAPGSFSFTVACNPSKIAKFGGTIKVSAEIKNTGATNIKRVSVVMDTTPAYDSDCEGTTWSGAIAPGASKTLFWEVEFAEADLDREIDMTVIIDNDADPLDDEAAAQFIKVSSEDNVFKSNGSHEPEKDVYYVGETVTVTDTMRNSLTIEAADLSLVYYFKTASHGTNYGDPIDLGDVAGGATAEYFFDYTFTEDDIGDFRIGSEITYMVSGKGPYNEFNIAHDFVVEPAPTPTPTPEETPTPAPELTPEPTPTPQATDAGVAMTDGTNAQDETTPAQEEAAEAEGGKQSFFSPRLLTVIMVVLIILLVAAVIVLVVVTAGRNKGKDDFS